MSGKSVRKQRGVALLVVLILLVMMSALAAKISQQFCRNLQKTRYQVSQQQLRWSIQSQQKAIEDRLQTYASGESKGLSPKGEWADPVETEGENFTVVSQIADAQTCFNVNNLLAADPTPAAQTAGALPEKPVKERIVEQLLADSGISAGDAEEIYQQLLDYLDGDTTTAKEGLEADAWAGVEPARQPANQMMRTAGELKLLPAFPASAYGRVSKVLCALPDSASKVDVNTLTEEQAPLLSALFVGSLSVDEATRLLASRPEEGWESMEAFLKELETNYPQTKDALRQVQAFLAVNSNYFRVNSTGNTDDLTLRVVSQLHVDNEAGKVITWQRRYRMVE
ncbi:type II secretion system minor pseudopilin GspK [Enterobacter pasteurii]|uniref:type II secretion system minor pseudopilin GspK n=1 Tax=Enterobacter pasteurii TaxID=3029761 RepID=UPI0011DDFE26|nr:type II secretion system minor pseudopilin GspK [Enterobacter pasteurii]QLA67100.1 type II secretion system minor pseudopilin GspK [Enterobacter pasteurii]